MQQRHLRRFFVVLFSLCFCMVNAEAARLGGGKSTGMQRQSVSQKSTASSNTATNASQSNTASAPQSAAAPKNNWLGPLAGLAAGIGLAALLSHFGLGEAAANLLLIALVALLAIVLIRRLLAGGRQQPAQRPLQYANAESAPSFSGLQQVPGAGGLKTPLPASATVAGLYGNAYGNAPAGGAVGGGHVPEDFDREAFTRIAKLNFLRLQTANDTRNYDDLREFLSPELFAEVKLQIDERGNATQITEVPRLDADILDVTTTVDQYIVSVRFHGMISEQTNTPATAFEEIWHLTKPVNGSRGWQVAGIQQLA